MTEATFGKSPLGKEIESVASHDQKTKYAQNTGDFSDRCVAKENLSIRELADILRFAG